MGEHITTGQNVMNDPGPRCWLRLTNAFCITALLLHGPAACLNECFATFGKAPLLKGIVEIYMPDMKYGDDNLA